MKYIPFFWDQSDDLLSYVTAPIIGASLKTISERPSYLTLWHPNSVGLQIFSKMQDVGERNEVGVLAFTVDRNLNDADIISLENAFNNQNEVKKLIIAPAAGVLAESGVIIRSSVGKEIVIVAGVYPYSLAIRGIFSVPHIFEPEYELGSYRHTRWEGAANCPSGKDTSRH